MENSRTKRSTKVDNPDKKLVMWVSNDPKDKPLILKTGGMIGINKKKFKKLREVINNEALDRFAND